MKSSYNICSVMGIPIRAHITLVIFLPFLVIYASRSPLLGLISALVAVAGFFASIALHELGHSYVAIRYDCSVRQILLMPIGGVAQLTHMPRNPRAEIAIALAGPAVSLALFAICFAIAVPASMVGADVSTRVLLTWSAVNLVLALFNLVPAFPMDGGRVFRAFMTPRVGRLRATRMASQIGRFLAIAFGLWGVVRLDFLHIAIAIFIHQAAGAEYKMVMMEEARARQGVPFPGIRFGSRPSADSISDEVVVSPPPYRNK